MKFVSIVAFLTLIKMVKGVWWAAAVQPLILSLGAVLGALDLDVLDNVQPFDLRNFLPFINKQEKTRPKSTSAAEAEESKQNDYLKKGESREKKYWRQKLRQSEKDVERAVDERDRIEEYIYQKWGLDDFEETNMV